MGAGLWSSAGSFAASRTSHLHGNDESNELPAPASRLAIAVPADTFYSSAPEVSPTQPLAQKRKKRLLQLKLEALSPDAVARQRRPGTPVAQLPDIPRAPRRVRSESKREFEARMQRLAVAKAARQQHDLLKATQPHYQRS